MDRAEVQPGRRVLDVGCGRGETTVELAGRVGDQGHVLGVDISRGSLSRSGFGEVETNRIVAKVGGGTLDETTGMLMRSARSAAFWEMSRIRHGAPLQRKFRERSPGSAVQSGSGLTMSPAGTNSSGLDRQQNDSWPDMRAGLPRSFQHCQFEFAGARYDFIGLKDHMGSEFNYFRKAHREAAA